jgi:hypothetical protein
MFRVRQVERRRAPADLTLDAQRLPAGRQNRNLGTALQQFGNRPGARIDQVLAVVEQDE